jgi:hypothetical protein
MRTYRDAKAMARSLRASLAARNVSLSHSECLEIVARQFGWNEWNSLAAALDAQAPPPRAPGLPFSPPSLCCAWNRWPLRAPSMKTSSVSASTGGTGVSPQATTYPSVLHTGSARPTSAPGQYRTRETPWAWARLTCACQVRFHPGRLTDLLLIVLSASGSIAVGESISRLIQRR